MNEPGALRSELWRLADRMRGPYDGGRLGVARAAVEEGLAPTWREQAAVAQELGAADAADPQVVAELMLALTAGRSGIRALDPWSGIGITMAALDDAGRLGPSLAIEINTDAYDVVRVSRSTRNIDWRLGDAAELLQGEQRRFDLVVGSPPLNLPTAAATVGPDRIPVQMSMSYVMVAQAAALLDPAGFMALVLPEAIFRQQGRGVLHVLGTMGIHPSAAIALPRRGFGHSISLSLVVLEPIEHADLFVAEVPGPSDVEAVAVNLKARRPGGLPGLGQLVDRSSFRSWRVHQLNGDVAAQARRASLVAVPFNELCLEVRTPRRGQQDAFLPATNAVYLPSVGNSPAVAAVDELRIKPQNYLQLVLDESRVDANYLASFLNSPLGRSVRELMLSGDFIPHVTRQGVLASIAFLPRAREQQTRATTVDRTLREFQQAVDGLRRRLWDDPTRARQVEGELRQLIEGDGPGRWRESLPFPLASILWRSDAEVDPEDRCRYLIHFFEALTIWLVDVHISALRQEAAALTKVRRTGNAPVEYGRASIGTWSDLLARLAKRTRAVVDVDPPLARELFRVGDLERIERVSSTALTSALREEASQYRNQWIGHGGPVRRDEWDRRFEAATGTLDRIRAAIGDAFTGWELVRPGQGGIRAGVVTLSIERLTGSQRVFRRSRVQLREWPEEGGLYMLEDGAQTALPLSPLFTLRRGPAAVEDACYFFGRMEGERVRWVSYHFEGEPEVVDEDPSVAGLISELDGLG